MLNPPGLSGEPRKRLKHLVIRKFPCNFAAEHQRQELLMGKYEEIEGWRLSNGKTIREIKSVTEPLALWFGLYFKDLFDNLK